MAKKRRPVGICKLCRKQTKLCHSHIIPEFFYKQIYDDSHRFIAISHTKCQIETLQKGLREYLLCEQCEQKLCEWEKYARNEFVTGEQSTLVSQTPNEVVLGNVDYTRFKLFLLSLLWRMGVSSLDEFQDVDLGAHEEVLRTAVLSGNPLSQPQYGCLIIAVTIEGAYQKWFMSPRGMAWHGCDWYGIVICGFLFLFCVSAQPPDEFHPLFVGKDGMLILNFQDIKNIPLLHDGATQIADLIRSKRGQ